MKNQKGISMITLIITIVVIIILAAIAIVASGDTINSAQFSTFASEFGDYAINYKTHPYAEIEEAAGLQGISLTEAQKYFAAARGTKISEVEDVLSGIVTPGGLGFTFDGGLKDAAGNAVTYLNGVACYQIKDELIEGYDEGHQFYGDNLGDETHWVTQKGFVFTLPGYPREVDGEFRMYISPEVYYEAGTNYANVTLGTEGTVVDNREADVADDAKGIMIESDSYDVVLPNP